MIPTGAGDPNRQGGPPATTKTTVEVSRPDPSGGGGVVVEKVTREISSAATDLAPPTISHSRSGSGGRNAHDASPAGGAPPASTGVADPPTSAQMAKLLERSMDGGGDEAAGRVAISGGAARSDDLISKMSKLLNDGDELNLAGLLNVLDGVVDTPDRILARRRRRPAAPPRPRAPPAYSPPSLAAALTSAHPRMRRS